MAEWLNPDCPRIGALSLALGRQVEGRRPQGELFTLFHSPIGLICAPAALRSLVDLISEQS